MARDISADDIAYVTTLVREDDLPRYYATLFSPPTLRDDLLAIYGFAAEIARVPNRVTEPALGEIRLKWWSESLAEAVRREGAGETPALRAAAAAIMRHALPLAAFEALAEAHGIDLYSDPPASLVDLEGQMGETQSALFQMAAIVSGASGPETADAAGHAGIAYGIARRLASFASDRARGRMIIPTDLLDANKLTAADALAPTPPAALHDAIAELAEFGLQHLQTARRHVKALPASARAVFLPLAIVGPLLRKIEDAPNARADVSLSNLASLTRIGWARLRVQAGRR